MGLQLSESIVGLPARVEVDGKFYDVEYTYGDLRVCVKTGKYFRDNEYVRGKNIAALKDGIHAYFEAKEADKAAVAKRQAELAGGGADAWNYTRNGLEKVKVRGRHAGNGDYLITRADGTKTQVRGLLSMDLDVDAYKAAIADIERLDALLAETIGPNLSDTLEGFDPVQVAYHADTDDYSGSCAGFTVRADTVRDVEAGLERLIASDRLPWAYERDTFGSEPRKVEPTSKVIATMSWWGSLPGWKTREEVERYVAYVIEQEAATKHLRDLSIPFVWEG